VGEIADMLLDGTLDSETGEYLGQGPGYPRTRADLDAWGRKRETKRKARQRARKRKRERLAAAEAAEGGGS
jgi:hypothetical protein